MLIRNFALIIAAALMFIQPIQAAGPGKLYELQVPRDGSFHLFKGAKELKLAQKLMEGVYDKREVVTGILPGGAKSISRARNGDFTFTLREPVRPMDERYGMFEIKLTATDRRLQCSNGKIACFEFKKMQITTNDSKNKIRAVFKPKYRTKSPGRLNLSEIAFSKLSVTRALKKMLGQGNPMRRIRRAMHIVLRKAAA